MTTNPQFHGMVDKDHLYKMKNYINSDRKHISEISLKRLYR